MDERTAPPVGEASSQEEWAPAEVEAMRAALDAAHAGERGANPLVGAAVLLADHGRGPGRSGEGRVVALGWHRGAGAPHAEVDALARARQAGADLRRATVVVTLEPCRHYGRTGPCTEAILEAGVRRVVYAVKDPSPQAGGGADVLRQAGVDVAGGLLTDQAAHLNHRWLRCAAEQRPFVTAKVAQTLDARTAAPDATSQWITGPQARAHAHRLRARCDAILIGTGTLAADDPRLSARDAQGEDLPHQPLRVVMGTTPVPEGAALREGRWLRLPTHDPREALSRLAAQGVRHVLVEGGATVTTAFLAHDLVDSLVVYQAPLLLGAGRPAVGDLGVTTLAQALHLEPDRPPVRLGDDLVLELSPTARPGSQDSRAHPPGQRGQERVREPQAPQPGGPPQDGGGRDPQHEGRREGAGTREGTEESTAESTTQPSGRSAPGRNTPAEHKEPLCSQESSRAGERSSTSPPTTPRA